MEEGDSKSSKQPTSFSATEGLVPRTGIVVGGDFSGRDDLRQHHSVLKDEKNCVDNGVQTSSHLGGVGITGSLEHINRSEDQHEPGRVEQGVAIGMLTVAEQAAEHMVRVRPRVNEIFGSYGIPSNQYALLAGFDESLIEDGTGYLQQIGVFTTAVVDVNSPLLVELGQTLSPFSSRMFTPSMKIKLPVFKPDGSIWAFDAFVLHSVAKFIDDEQPGAVNPTITRGTSHGGAMMESHGGQGSTSKVAGSKDQDVPDDHNDREGVKEHQKRDEDGDKNVDRNSEDEEDDPGV